MEDLREAARQSIDAFIENRRIQLIDYIQGENDMLALQNALNQLVIMDGDVSNPALVAGEVAQEILNPQELNEVRDIARQSVLNFVNVQIPQVLNSINALNDMHSLEDAINELNTINADITNPALLA